MATHALGNLKFNLSDKGFAWKMGDGKVHRLFGKKAPAEDEYEENIAPDGEDGYQDAYDAQDSDYSDDYDDRADDYADDTYDDGSYAEDGYDDDGYDDDHYDDDYADDDYEDDDGYADDGYDDDGYADDGYADDGYDDDGYDDDGYDDDGYDDGYDDRYSDVDADDYREEDAYDDEQGGLMRYVDENDWVTYLLLFLFPPLGIYLLWRRNRFEKPLRWGLTAASAIWFVVALILLLRGLFGGTGDAQTQPSITIPPAQVEATAAPIADDVTSINLGGGETTLDTDDGTETGDTGDTLDTGDTGDTTVDVGGLTGDTDVEPTATPLASSANGSNANTASYVWSPASGLYYHSTNTCPSIEDGVQVWQVTKEIAENSRHQSPCPDCIGGGTTTTYYARPDGKYYHSDSTCSNMKNAQVYTLEAAQNEGKEPCPVCVLKTQTSLDPATNAGLQFVTSSTTDKSGIEVYATQRGDHFHVKSDCSGMQGASKGSLKDALLAGKTACPKCCPTAGNKVYCRSDSKSYHVDPNCQGMKNAKQITLAEAMVLGKEKCDVCIGSASASISENTSGSDSGSTVSLTSATGDKVKVYATQNGTYYHTNSTCSGMKDAQLYTLKAMLQAGKKACPTCASAANTKVYAVKGGKYYHSYATCSDMKDASSGTLAEALAAGLKRCPKCWDKSGNAVKASTQTASNSSAATATSTSSSSQASTSAKQQKATTAASKATASNTYVYATKDGRYYHLNSSCGGMTGASRVTLKKAINAGKTACPICASTANRTVYSTSKGDHYHAASVCVPSGMKNGSKRKLSEALMMGQTACPYCLSSKKAAKTAQATAEAVQEAVQTAARTGTNYKSGQSGVRVYASLTGKYYHTKSNCPKLSGTANRVSLETALNYGKAACPECASTASRTVYATRGGKYYHTSKTCAGTSAKKGTLASALAYGLDPCPNCVTHTASVTSSGLYRSGTSGIKVYATAGSKYYHANSTCSGLTGASRVTLETALNYGKKACPVCLSAANHKVYAVSGDTYYHAYRAHAGSGAISGTLATARAVGLKACPVCAKVLQGQLTTTENRENPDNGSDPDAPVSNEHYPGLPDSSVYIDIGSANNYYHLGAKCTKAKFSGGTKVTLQYAIDWDYKACPYCNPPTSVYNGSDT